MPNPTNNPPIPPKRQDDATNPPIIPASVVDMLKQQLELQKEILSAQTRSVELQQTLLQAFAAWEDPKVAEAKLAEADQRFEERATEELLPVGQGATESCKHAEEQQKADETQKDAAARELEEFLETYDVWTDYIPWRMAPKVASFLGIMKLSMFRHPGDLAVCFPDRSAFFGAAEAAMSPGRYREFLVASLELRLLFQSLLLSITVPASLAQTTPKSHFELMISVFTFLLGFFNTLGTALCIFATGILSSVSDSNINSWLKANHRYVHAALSSQCVLVPLIVFLQITTQIKTQLSVDWLDHDSQMVMCGIQIFLAMFFMTLMLVMTNAAGRSAAFSGAMGDPPIPSSTSVFCSTLGGDKIGFSGIQKYLTAVREGNEKPSSKRKGLLHKAKGEHGLPKVNLKKFDMFH